MSASLEGDGSPEPSTPVLAVRPVVQLAASPFNSSDPAWTATRYAMLLRPLESRIHELYDLRNICPHPSPTRNGVLRPRVPLRIGSAEVTRRHKSGEKSYGSFPCSDGNQNDEDDDPDWEPRGNGKRLKVYKSKAARAMRQKASRNELSYAFDSHLEDVRYLYTQSARVAGPQPPPSNPGMVKDRPASGLSEAESRYLKVEASMVDHFKRIMIQTKSSVQQPGQKGVPSLLNLCLKNIPEHIEHLEGRLEQDYEEAAQVAYQVFAELEQYGATSKKGWKPIRVAIRAKALKEVSDAIVDGTLAPRCAYKIAWFCKEFGTHQDSKSIYDALFEVCAPLRMQQNASTVPIVKKLYLAWGTPSIGELYNAMAVAGKGAIFFQVLADLLGYGIIPMAWLANGDLPHIFYPTLKLLKDGDPEFQNSVHCWSVAYMIISGIFPEAYSVLTSQEDSVHMRHQLAVLPLREPNRIFDDLFSEMVHHQISTWFTLIAFHGHLPNAKQLTSRLCDLASHILRSQAATPTNFPRMSPATKYCRAIILFACLLLPASPHFDGYPSASTFELLWAEWVKVSYDVPLRTYVPLMIGPKFSPNVSVAFDQIYEQHVNHAEVRRLVDVSESYFRQVVRRTADFVVKLALNSLVGFTLRVPSKLRTQLLWAVRGTAMKLSPNNPRSAIEDEWSELLEAIFNDKPDDCDCSMAGCRQCGIPGSEWRWDPKLEEWIRPRRDLIRKEPESKQGHIDGQSDQRATRQAAPSHDRRVTLSAMTDTPLTSKIDSARDVQQSAPPMRQYQPRVLEDDERQVEVRLLSLDGACDMSDEDELSVLQERPINLKVSRMSMDSTQNKDPVTVTKGHAHRSKSAKKARRTCRLNKGSRPLHKDRTSAGFTATLHKTVSAAKEKSLKRKWSVARLNAGPQDNSDDELAR